LSENSDDDNGSEDFGYNDDEDSKDSASLLMLASGGTVDFAE
jgi:hypothetical protein